MTYLILERLITILKFAVERMILIIITNDAR